MKTKNWSVVTGQPWATNSLLAFSAIAAAVGLGMNIVLVLRSPWSLAQAVPRLGLPIGVLAMVEAMVLPKSRTRWRAALIWFSITLALVSIGILLRQSFVGAT